MPLWRLTKGERIADACVWLHSHGRELRISVDGALVFSRLFPAWRPDDNLESAAGELLGQFNGKGWLAR